MGEALIRGILSKGLMQPGQVVAYDIRQERLRDLKDMLAIETATSASEAAGKANVIILAVKPGDVGAVLDELAPTLQPVQVLVSIAAGIRLGFIEQRLSRGIPVVRVMPNTPALVGEGVCAISRGTYADEAHENLIRSLLEAIGNVVVLPEHLLDVVTGLSGSGPAYVCLVVEALADGAVAEGLPRSIALQLAAQTVAGAGQWIRQALAEGVHPAVLREQVTSPGGTTAAGLGVLEASATRAAFSQAVQAAARRSKELGDA